jgi:para-nitrobenzyl esterase
MQQKALHRSRLISGATRGPSHLRHAVALWVALGLGALGGCDSSDDDDVTEETAPVGGEDAATSRDGSSGPGKSDAASGGNVDAGSKSDAASGNRDAGGGATVSSTLTTPNGTLKGEVAQDNGKQVLIFRGVPYAKAPVGDLRWKPPVPVEPWKETREATEWGNRCPQGESTLSSPGPMSEDCLNLNVLTPATKTSEKLPVMVFFHGGGLTVGTGNSPTYCHTALPAQGVVVVTVNSRLGAFGYFSHPALAAESDKNASGNYGTLDLIESLRWVQKNITAFGGDPKNVTIFGESGGGTKVLSCMASPLAQGLFHRAIVESGSGSSGPMGTTARATAEESGKRVVAKLNIAEDPETLKKLREAKWEDVQAASTAMDTRFIANLSIDGYVLPQSINEAFAQGKQVDVPLIVGANEGEGRELRGPIPALAASMSTVTSKAYVYNFTHLPKGWRDPGCYSFHGLELAYVFGHMEGVNGPTMVFLGSQAGCMPMKDPMVGDDDRLVAKNTMAMWTQFAKTGNPSVAGVVDWPAYTMQNDTYLAIGEQLEVKMGVVASGKTPGLGDGGVPDAGAAPAGDAGPRLDGGLASGTR